MEDESKTYSLAELYKVFGDATRVRILCTLMDGEKCVGETASALSMTDSAVSHQLKILKQARLVTSRRDGKSAIYSLADDHVKTIIENGLEHVNEI